MHQLCKIVFKNDPPLGFMIEEFIENRLSRGKLVRPPKNEVIGKNDRIEAVETWEMDCFESAWNEWFATEHKYASGDKQFFDKLIKPYTCFVGICIKLK